MRDLVSPIVFGCAGLALGEWERSFFRDVQPLGFILFARNIENHDQIRRLTRELRDAVGREDAPILIDQEGGRVRRLRPPLCRDIAPAADFGALAASNQTRAERAVYVNHRLMADELMSLGINVNCAPLVDLRLPGAHDIIGDRSFGGNPDVVASLGRAAARGLADGGVTPIIKHIPGHGRALVDSHFDLPRVGASLIELRETDFRPFRALAEMPWAMTAHVVYEAIDERRPASLSPVVIGDIIRRDIGFDGLLICDDLSMKALSGGLQDLAKECLAAGCDIVLHCNGLPEEMQAVAAGAKKISDKAIERYHRGALMVGGASACDTGALRDELSRFFA